MNNASESAGGRAINFSLIATLVIFHIVIIALANYTVQFTGEFLGQPFTYAMFVFPLVILATDLTIRLSHTGNARSIVAIAYFPAILISAWLADWRIGMASATAYLTGQLLDIFVFQKIRERSAAWWTAPLISTLFANAIDTYVFFGAAFYRSADEFMAQNWLSVAHVDLAFKITVSALLFLPLYGVLLRYLTGRLKTPDQPANPPTTPSGCACHPSREGE